MATGPIGQQGSLRPPLKGATRLLEFKVQEGITDQPVDLARNHAARLGFGLHHLGEAPPQMGRAPRHLKNKGELIGPAKPESGKSMHQLLALNLETFHW